MRLASDLRFSLAVTSRKCSFILFLLSLGFKTKEQILYFVTCLFKSIKGAYDFSLLFCYIIRFLDMEPSWRSWMNPSCLCHIFMYNWISCVHILFKIFLIIIGLVFICETIWTSFGNCDGFFSFIGLYGRVVFFKFWNNSFVK